MQSSGMLPAVVCYWQVFQVVSGGLTSSEWGCLLWTLCCSDICCPGQWRARPLSQHRRHQCWRGGVVGRGVDGGSHVCAGEALCCHAGGIRTADGGRRQLKSCLLHFMLLVLPPSLFQPECHADTVQSSNADHQLEEHLKSSPAPGPVALPSVGGPQEPGPAPPLPAGG